MGRSDWLAACAQMDVEGAEWAVLDALVRGKEPLAFTQLQARPRCTHLVSQHAKGHFAI